jgi:transcriptional regulator with XRE-family HTH domain
VNKLDNPLKSAKGYPIALPMTLKRQLRFYLDLHDLTAAQLARKASVPKQSLSGWLAGSNPRDVKQVKRVADALGVSLDNLMFGQGEDANSRKHLEMNALLGDDWIGGVFEVRIRRVRGKT